MGMTVKLATQGTYSGHTLRSPFISSTNNCCVFYRMYMFIYFIQETLHFLFIWEKKNGLKSKFFCRVIFIKNTRHIGIMKTNMICTFVSEYWVRIKAQPGEKNWIKNVWLHARNLRSVDFYGKETERMNDRQILYFYRRLLFKQQFDQY